MNDLYMKLAHSTLGHSIFDALNLPQPVELVRSPNESIAIPNGPYLIAASSQSFALNNTLNIFANSNLEVNFLEQVNTGFQVLPNTFNESECIKRVADVTSHHYKGLIYDATGISDFDGLATIYEFFHLAISTLGDNGKIIILAQKNSQIKDSQTASIQLSLIGFCKSMAKELGKKGINCNLIYIQKGAQKYLDTSLAFFLSPKSAYITGQFISLGNHTLKQFPASLSKPLEGKTALVTGAAQGIGKETAIILARDGATVICLDIPQNQKALDVLAKEIQGHALAIDLLNENAIEDVTQNIFSQAGVIDIVVHNAGITRDKTLAKMPRHLWDQVLTLNFERVVKLNQAFLEKNIFNDHARIICISSISGIAGNFGQSNYACSKAGIAAYVKAFANSAVLKKNNGLTINAIAPGFIETQMTKNIPFITRELGRRMNALSQGGLPLDIAETVSFFANPGSHCLNGNVLRVCGLSLLGK
ncbi:MAG: 3-oxoacyl-[acyl-carrier protein] reductase [Psychroserpens sp.]|jgi:3-oxoacyl-[acyl-carrier protein] reductase